MPLEDLELELEKQKKLEERRKKDRDRKREKRAEEKLKAGKVPRAKKPEVVTQDEGSVKRIPSRKERKAQERQRKREENRKWIEEERKEVEERIFAQKEYLEEKKREFEAKSIEDRDIMQKNFEEVLEVNKEYPLHLAIQNGKSIDNIVRNQLGNINSKNSQGETPLHIAVRYGGRFTIKHLIKNGADTTIENNVNQTPTELASALQKRDQKKAINRALSELDQGEVLISESESEDLEREEQIKRKRPVKEVSDEKSDDSIDWEEGDISLKSPTKKSREEKTPSPSVKGPTFSAHGKLPNSTQTMTP